jgi:hypothetical protein
MVIEVTYQTKKDAADRHSKFNRMEYFETSVMPNKEAVTAKLSAMRKSCAEETISISEFKKYDAKTMRRKGFRVTTL